MRSKRRRELACHERGFEPSAPSERCSEGRIGRNREYCKRQRSKTTIFQPALWVSRSESRRGCSEAAVVYVNPSVKPSVCQLPVRGAFWYCIASNIKHGDGFPSPQLYDLSRSPAVRRISHCASNISLRFSAISPCVSRISPRA